MKPNQRRAGLSWFPPRRAESILRSGLPKMGPTVPLGDNFRCPETRVLAPTTCDGLRNQRCPSRNPWPADKRTTPLRSPSHWRNVTRRSPFEKNTGKRNLRGPGVASRLQLCGIASTAHPPVCTSRRENAFVATGCFNIYSAVSDWCCAQFSQMFVSLFTGFRWQRRAQCELIQIDWRVAAIICLPPPHLPSSAPRTTVNRPGSISDQRCCAWNGNQCAPSCTKTICVHRQMQCLPAYLTGRHHNLFI